MTDQAEGLRRLFGRNFVRVVAFTGPAQGDAQSVLVAALSGVMAQRGKRVLVIDERRDAGVYGAWHIARTGDLADVLSGRKQINQAITAAPFGVLGLSAARGLAHLRAATAKKQEALLRAFQDWEQPIDVVLIDTAPGAPDEASASFMRAAHDVVNLVTPEPHVIKEAYATIKMMTQQASRAQFHVLLHRVKDPVEGQTIFANMSRASRNYLDISLDYLGALPAAEAASHGLFNAAPSAASATEQRQTVGAIADAIQGWPLPADDIGALDSFLHRWMQHSRLPPKEIRY